MPRQKETPAIPAVHEALDVLTIEDGGHRLDRAQFIFDLFEERRFEHARVLCGFIAVVFKDVPAAKNQLIQLGERHELADRR